MHDQPNQALTNVAVGPEPVQAYGVMNTVRALELLAADARSAPELADALGISVRTARRMLQRLAAEGYLVQDAGHRRRYRPTLRLVALASQVLERAVLPRVAARHVADLPAASGGDAHLWIWADDGAAVCLVHAPAGEAGATSRVMTESAGGAAAVVLAPVRSRQRSCAFVAGDDSAVAAAVLDRDRVVAALGVTGDVAVDQLALVSRHASQITHDLAAAAASFSAPRTLA